MSDRFVDRFVAGSGYSILILLLESCLQTRMTYKIAVYGEKLLMMDMGIVRNM
jgi:hypothetical protein